ncbi:MAG: hypothetical protein Q9187_009634, partial [Circinaria calcarea]
RQDLKKAIISLLDEMTRHGGAARYAEVYKRISEQGSAQVDATEFSDALRSLEQEGQVSVSGEGPRRNIRRISGTAIEDDVKAPSMLLRGLRTSLIKDYYYYYISYDYLKNALKTPFESEPSPDNPNPQRRPWTEDDEKSFVAQLEAELDKVYTFQRVKSEEIVRRIKASEREVNEVIARLDGRDVGEPAQNGNPNGAKEGTP